MRKLWFAVGQHRLLSQLGTVGEKGLDAALRLNRAIGLHGERFVGKAFGLSKELAHKAYNVASSGGYRVFDYVKGNVFIEVKNVAKLVRTQQLVDMANIAMQQQGAFYIIVRASTHIPPSVFKWAMKNHVQIVKIM